MQKKKLKKENGITLIALVLTVIIMIILAGITFNALFGDNGILGNAMSAKTKQEDSSAKEEIQLAWSARMSKFYEDVSTGRANYVDMIRYFEAHTDELNTMLGNGGKITGLSYDPKTKEFNISYKSSSNVSYIGKIKSSGEITKLERSTTNINYTGIWANFFGAEGKLTYSSTKDSNADISWNVSQPINDVPWYKDGEGNDVSSLYANNITKVDIEPDLIPQSTNFMFYKMSNLEEINNLDNLLSNTSKIGDNMFYSCEKLTSISIPENVTSIGSNSFYNCTALENLEIPNNVISIEAGAFLYCKNLKNIEIPDSVTNIGAQAFRFCSSLENITIPENVEKIGKCCFGNCASLRVVNYNAKDAEIVTETIVTSDSSIIVNSESYESCLLMPLFWGDDIVELNIGENVKKIPATAFASLTITNLEIPDNVEMIGDGAFYFCKKLEEVNISSNLAEIGKEAFKSCSSLTTITIPENVEKIGTSCFSNCTSLTVLNYNAKDASQSNFFVSDNTIDPAFSSYLKTVNIGSSARTLPEYLFAFSGIETVNMENGIEEIQDSVFYKCELLKNVTIAESIKKIGKMCFSGCSNLQKVNYNAIDATESEVWDGTYCYPIFTGAYQVSEIIIGDKVEKIPDYAFMNCTEIASVNLPNSLISLGKQSFYKCTELTNITIPSNVTSIGGWCFGNCTSLATITINKVEESISGSPWAAPSATVIWQP